MKFLRSLFGGLPANAGKRYYTFTVKCLRCGEAIEGRVDLSNDLSVEYEGGREVYFARKVLIGGERCFQRIETTFQFDAARKLIERQAAGGEFA
jgi:hypothetical protein